MSTRDDQVRIGDAERSSAADALGEHFAAGRISSEEFSERLDQVWAARTAPDLRPLFADLPGNGGLPVASSTAGSTPRPTRGATDGRRGGPPSAGRSRSRPPFPVVVVLAIAAMIFLVTHLPLVIALLGVLWFTGMLRGGRRGGCGRGAQHVTGRVGAAR